MVSEVAIQISGCARHLRGSSTPLPSPRRGRVSLRRRVDPGVTMRFTRAVGPFPASAIIPPLPPPSHCYTASPLRIVVKRPQHYKIALVAVAHVPVDWAALNLKEDAAVWAGSVPCSDLWRRRGR